MARVKKLKSVAYGLCDHFLSLYNRINGYWALGVLYKQALNVNTKVISIEITGESIKPSSIQSDELIEHFKMFLHKLLDNHNIKNNVVYETFINITFDVEPTKLDLNLSTLFGNPLICEVIIIDIDNNKYVMEQRDRCKEFDKGNFIQNIHNKS